MTRPDLAHAKSLRPADYALLTRPDDGYSASCERCKRVTWWVVVAWICGKQFGECQSCKVVKLNH